MKTILMRIVENIPIIVDVLDVNIIYMIFILIFYFISVLVSESYV